MHQTLQVAAGGNENTRPLVPDQRHAERWSYTLPASGHRIQLLSHPFVPSQCIPESLDQRRLGVRVAAVCVDGIDLPLDAPAYQQGFYPTEITSEGPCRWTNGTADLALPDGARSLVLHLVDPVSAVA
jgi:hypothetical protein